MLPSLSSIGQAYLYLSKISKNISYEQVIEEARKIDSFEEANI